MSNIQSESIVDTETTYIASDTTTTATSQQTLEQQEQQQHHQHEIPQHYDIIVVGAGVAGAVLARTLGVAGRRVLCVERDLREPDRIVGELMQPGGVRALRQLGLGECFEGIDATPAYGYGIFKPNGSVKLSYPRDASSKPINGFSFHHGSFVQKLRHQASLVENVTLIEGTVKSLIEESDVIKGVRYSVVGPSTSNNTPSTLDCEAFAPLTIVCDGCFSNLRRSLITQTPQVTSTFVSMILRDCELPYPDHGHVFLVDPSPILMYRIGSNEIRVLVDVPGDKCPPNSQLKTTFEFETAPQLPEQLRAPFIHALHNDQLKKMPNSRLHPDDITRPGVIMIGDAWNMRHPLTGAGMTVALSDVCILTSLLATCSQADLQDHTKIAAIMVKFRVQRTPLASTMNVLAGALYRVFSADNDHLRQACLGYLGLGGEFSAGPVALLSGLRPRPSVLAMHFFAVALYGVMRTLWPFPTPGRIKTCYRILSAAAEIIVPLLRRERVLKSLCMLCNVLRLTDQ